MDLKLVFKKIREIEASIAAPHVVVTSKETPDGGKAGVLTEVSRSVAATLIAEGKAELAAEEAVKGFLEKAAEIRRLAEQAAAASRIQVTVVSETDPRASKSGARASRG
jgi:hypothetical protein